MAIAEANRQGVDLAIVLATIDAESEFTNMIGDQGNAYGPGQVWYMWWPNNFDYAANYLKFQLPSDTDSLQQFVLDNDLFSVILAVKTIKDVWNSSNKNWHDFTLAYVGSGISETDYNRRLAIWQKYSNNSDASNYSTAKAAGNYGAAGSATNPYDPTKDAIFKPTNNQVVPNSLLNGNILWGRKYRILVNTPSGVALDVSQLRCTFKVYKTILMQPNLSEVTIYNLNANTENAIISEGNEIIIEAGYEGNSQYGIIFRGQIIQPIRDKEDGHTYKLTLTSLDGDAFMNWGVMNVTYTKGQTKRAIVEDIVNKASNPAKFGSISENFDTQQLTRGKVVFGLARDYLRQIAQSQQASFYVEDGKVNIVKADDMPSDEAIELNAKSGLVGSPAQSEYGITFKCLLNPRIKLGTFVHIDNRLIKETQITPVLIQPNQKANAQIIRVLDGDGLYKVISINHIGDTRGDDFYTECVTISQRGLVPDLLSSPKGKPN